VKRGALVLVLAAAAAFPPAASAADRCSAPGAKTILQNAQARLFSVKGKGAVKRRIYGCVRGRKPILLTSDLSPKDPEQTHTGNGQFRLTGRFAGWVSASFSDFGAGEFGRSIEVRPLEKGHRKLSQDVSDYQDVGALALRADGAVAWILRVDSDYNEVDEIESTSRTATPLAYARGIDPAALRVDAASVFWKQDGAERSAPLR
jgi:hypothetical protein